jgi:hypothetical protein
MQIHQNMPRTRFNFAAAIASNHRRIPPGVSAQERARQMRDGASRMVAAAIGAIALSCVGVGMAGAADVPIAPRVQQPPPPQYYAEEEYYEPAYVVRPPAPVYVYPPV